VASLDKGMQEYIDKKFDMEKIDEIMDLNNIMHGFHTNN
jgi:hypothetical protein